MMLAAVLEALNRPLALRRVPVPEPGEGEVRVRVEASGLCSSDLHYIKGSSRVGKMPLIPGHEFAGTVDKKGPGAEGVEVNDAVAVHYLLSCGRCEFCSSGRDNLCGAAGMLGKTADGGFAEYAVVPARNAVPVPEGVSMEQAAIAADAVVTPWHAAKLARLRPGDAVVVAGIGGLGAHAVQMPGLFGAGEVIAVDVSDEKLTLAAELGATRTLNASREDTPARVMDITGGAGANAVIDLTGSKKSIEDSLASLAIAGRMVIVGICPEKIEVDSYRDILLKEAVVTGNRDHTAGELREVLALAADGKIDLSRSVSLRLRLGEINEGLKILEEGRDSPVRIVITDMSS